jgi:hypothetical protein
MVSQACHRRPLLDSPHLQLLPLAHSYHVLVISPCTNLLGRAETLSCFIIPRVPRDLSLLQSSISVLLLQPHFERKFGTADACRVVPKELLRSYPLKKHTEIHPWHRWTLYHAILEARLRDGLSVPNEQFMRTHAASGRLMSPRLPPLQCRSAKVVSFTPYAELGIVALC